MSNDILTSHLCTANINTFIQKHNIKIIDTLNEIRVTYNDMVLNDK